MTPQADARSVVRGMQEKAPAQLLRLRSALDRIRAGRAHPQMLDRARVPRDGSLVPLAQLASVSVADARTLLVQPWDKASASAIEKAIRESEPGLGVGAAGDKILVALPALTVERRQELAKAARIAAEETKIALRALRREANDALRAMAKRKSLSADEERRALAQIQKLLDEAIREADQQAAEKKAQVLSS
jgi:ribosome recycling factor